MCLSVLWMCPVLDTHIWVFFTRVCATQEVRACVAEWVFFFLYECVCVCVCLCEFGGKLWNFIAVLSPHFQAPRGTESVGFEQRNRKTEREFVETI